MMTFHAQRQMNAWGQLHALRMEFHRRLEQFKQNFLGKDSSFSGSADPTELARGVHLVHEEFEQYKFKKLAMACFFESSFTRFKVDSCSSGTEVAKDSPARGGDEGQRRTTVFRSGSSSSSGPEDADDSFDAQIRQQRIMSGVPTDPNDMDGSDEDRFGLMDTLEGAEEDRLASIQPFPAGSSNGPTARDYEFLRNNLPTLSDLSSSEDPAERQSAASFDRTAKLLHKDGFFDLLHRSGTISDANFSATLPSTDMSAYEREGEVYDEEEISKRSGQATATKTRPVGRFARSQLGASPSGSVSPPGELKPEIKYRAPNGSMSSEDVKYARSIRRSELLNMINGFLSNFGISPIQRRDLIWTEWFLGTYLELSHEDRVSGRPLLVLDKRSSSTFVEAVKRIHDECTKSAHHQNLKRARESSAEELDAALKRTAMQQPQMPGFSPTCAAQRCGSSSSPAAPLQSLLFPGAGSVVVMRPLASGSDLYRDN
jgi:hypothetical protein